MRRIDVTDGSSRALPGVEAETACRVRPRVARPRSHRDSRRGHDTAPGWQARQIQPAGVLRCCGVGPDAGQLAWVPPSRLVRGANVPRVDVPKTRYARSGELSIAYQVFGSGPIDVAI